MLDKVTTSKIVWLFRIISNIDKTKLKGIYLTKRVYTFLVGLVIVTRALSPSEAL